MRKKKNAPGTLARRNQIGTARAAAVFLLPAVLILCIYIFYPIADTFAISLFRWNGISAERTWIGLANWRALMGDGHFWKAFLHNLLIMILSICIQIPTGLLLATFLEIIEKRRGLTRVLKVVWFLPYLMSSVAVGFLFTYALSPNGGMISALSGLFGGGNVDLLGNQKMALLTLILIIAWQFIPFYMVYAMAGYAGIPADIYEAARIDGASRGRYFLHVAIPLLRPTLTAAAVLSLVGSLKYFDLIYVMTGGGPGHSTELMATYMYKQSFGQFNMGYGSAVAGGMFLLITAVALAAHRILNGKEVEG